MGTWTPWGSSGSARSYGRGVMSYTTDSHGGFHLSPARNAKVHESVRSRDGWYEEDVDWAVVALTFPELFSANEHASARATLRMYYPESWDTLAAAGVVTLDEAATALAPEAFDRLAQHLAHEEADGEEVLPKHWVRAAKMVYAGER